MPLGCLFPLGLSFASGFNIYLSLKQQMRAGNFICCDLTREGDEVSIIAELVLDRKKGIVTCE